MDALAHPVRLAILREVRDPRPLRDIVVRGWEGESRPLARQTVKAHIDRLVEAGFIRVEARRLNGRPTSLYCTNPEALRTFVEALGAIGESGVEA